MAERISDQHVEPYGGIPVFHSQPEQSTGEQRQQMGARILAQYAPFYGMNPEGLAAVEEVITDTLAQRVNKG